MSQATAPIQSLRQQYRDRQSHPATELEKALMHANSNNTHNVYLVRDADWSRGEASRLSYKTFYEQPLWGIPVSLKDCFDLTGFTTSCGSVFYQEQKGKAATDSTVATKLHTAGAVITGKTHLHQLAYGITGQNADFGDCVQPSDPMQLTGGSSSGAAASVQEGSALAAIGTDTGGSIRVPAALCGLCGYRSSITLNTQELWQGGAHLAPTFDTLGWLYRDLADGPLLANALLDLPFTPSPELASLTIGIPEADFFFDCEPCVLNALNHWQSKLAQQHVQITRFDATIWQDAFEILAPIQASEAATLHHGNFQHFESAIADRLTWGESISPEELATYKERLRLFRIVTHALFQRFDYLLLPCAPVSALYVADDHTHTRTRILRYTAPVSLCGLPAVTLPGGMQLVGPLGRDAALLALSTQLANLS